MTKKYICAVNRDMENNELELLNTKKFQTSTAESGAIKFSDCGELDKYFSKHCVSEDALQNAGSNVFTFLFLTLLVIFLLILIVPMFKGRQSEVSFGRFNF